MHGRFDEEDEQPCMPRGLADRTAVQVFAFSDVGKSVSPSASRTP